MSEQKKYWEPEGYTASDGPVYWVPGHWMYDGEGTDQEKYDRFMAEAVRLIREFKSEHRPYLHECPCCGERSIIHPGNLEQCDVCGWYDDPEQSEDPATFWEDDDNPLSLNDARRWWESTHKPLQPITEVPHRAPNLPPISSDEDDEDEE